MFQDEDTIQTAKPAADDLEPYRRLIELQKQMIELVRQHEKTRGECVALRAQLLEEMTSRRRTRWSLHRVIGRPTAGWVNTLAARWKPRAENRPESKRVVSPFLPDLSTK